MLNPAHGVPENVDDFRNYYQRRGGRAVIRHVDGSIRDPRFGTWFSARLKGGAIQPIRAASSNQIQVEKDLQDSEMVGELPNAGGRFLLRAAEVNHDVLPLYVKQLAIDFMR